MSRALVHGLAEEWVEPDWPAPTADELVAVLAQYQLGKPEPAIWLSPRPLSSAVLIPIGDLVVLVKRHHRDVRTAGELRVEHRFTDHLRARGIPTPTIHSTTGGDTAVELGTWCYEVQAQADGEDRYRDAMSWTPFRTTSEAREAGRTLARLHLAASSFDEPERTTATLSSRTDVLRSGSIANATTWFSTAHPQAEFAIQKGDYQFLDQWLRTVSAALAELPSQWVHNDWHASNLLWDGPRVATVIDFGLADRSYPIVDLAIALERNVFRWLELPKEDIGEVLAARALLDGYGSIRPISQAERDLLPQLLPVCHLDFAFSEVAYFARVLRDPDRAAIAWHEYAIAHAAWFTSSSGTAFLAQLTNYLSN